MNESSQSTTQANTSTAPPRVELRAAEWWRANISDAAGDRAARAQLRRCSAPLDALAIPAAIGFARRLGAIPEPGATSWSNRRFERVLALAIVLSHVRADTGLSLMRTLGWGQFPYDKLEADAADGQRPKLSELRFKRLLQTEGSDELIAAFVRLLALAGGETDIADLARVILRWDDDRTKRDLALSYFRASTRGIDD